MSILDELRREFPGFSFGPICSGHAKAWKGPNEPVESDANLYALVERSSSGGFNGYPFRGGSAKFPTLIEAAEYALGEKAESTKAREGGRGTLDDIDEALAALRNAFPGCTWSAALGKDARGSCIHADEDTDSPVDVQFMAPGRWLTIRGNREWSGTTAIESFHRFDSGLPCDITTTGRVINAEVPPDAEAERLAPFRKAWPEWTWSSPDADTYIGEVDGETWTCQREPGDSFRAHSSLCSAVCYHEDAYQAMRAMMAWLWAGRPKTIKSDATQVRPAHYGGTSNPYECIKVIRAWGLNFELGNVAKYLSRAGKKPGVEAIDDLRKLITYAQMEIERLETEP